MTQEPQRSSARSKPAFAPEQRARAIQKLLKAKRRQQLHSPMAYTKEMPRWGCVFFLAIGLYIVLLSLGVLPYTPSTRKRALFDSPQHWQATCSGIVFVCAGISIAFKGSRSWLLVLNGMVLLACLVAVMGWLLFYSGAVDLPMQIVGGLVMGVGALGAVAGVVQTARGRQGADLHPAKGDPIAMADAYRAHGRSAQARHVLESAMRRDPSRAAEFKRKLEEIGR